MECCHTMKNVSSKARSISLFKFQRIDIAFKLNKICFHLFSLGLNHECIQGSKLSIICCALVSSFILFFLCGYVLHSLCFCACAYVLCLHVSRTTKHKPLELVMRTNNKLKLVLLRYFSSTKNMSNAKPFVVNVQFHVLALQW